MKGFEKQIREVVGKWSSSHFMGLAVFNLVLIFLFLLYSAGYFRPFVPISINLIVLVGFILSIFLLGARSRVMFIISLFFFLFAGFLKIAGVDPWAERTAIYTYQSFVVGIVLLIIQNTGIMKENKK